jgi:hypothetical protein
MTGVGDVAAVDMVPVEADVTPVIFVVVEAVPEM